MTDRWTGCLDDLRELAKRLSSQVTEGGSDRAADLAVKMFGATMGAYLQHLQADSLHPVFLPSAGYYQMYGSPNPDTMYRTAVVDDDGDYLISGYRGTAPDVSIMPFGGPSSRGLQTFAPFDLGPPAANAGDMFAFRLSRQRPPARSASTASDVPDTWWRLEPGMRSLMLRTVSDEWGAHTEPRVAITRLDVDPRRTRPTDEHIDQRLRYFSSVAEAMIMSGVNRVKQLRADGVVNQLVEVDYSANGGLASQWYHEGCFSLDVDQVLLVEARLPRGCHAFSLSLTDAFFSTIDWSNAQSSLNQRQAVIDPDGALRILVSRTDPGVHNWLDTTGHGFGVVQCRWMGGDRPPDVSAKVLAATTVGDTLPSGVARVTATQRAEAIRARHIGVQLRSPL